MHPAVTHLLKQFKYEHLPPNLQHASRPFCELAIVMSGLPSNPETAVCLRKLLEAKDCAVRAVIAGEQ